MYEKHAYFILLHVWFRQYRNIEKFDNENIDSSFDINIKFNDNAMFPQVKCRRQMI